MTIGFIGTGNMGGALMAAMGKQYRLCAYNRGREKLLRVCRETGAEPMDSAEAVAAAADLLILAVKPGGVSALLAQISPVLRAETIVVSVAVGLPLSLYEAALGSTQKIVRAMPNTPAAVGAGVTALCFNAACTEVDRALVTAAFSTAGLAEIMPESLMGGVSALTGCSPAYICMLIEAMADAGVYQGIPRAQACRMAAQAVLGTAKLVLESGKHPEQLKDEVCSPGGTTIRGVASLEQDGFRSAILRALNVSAEASKE